MNHSDHLQLIREGVTPGIWADFGSGEGAFTLALADLLGKRATIYSIDRNNNALKHQRAAMEERFPNRDIHYLSSDFTYALNLPLLDGALLANSFHFIRQKEAVLTRIRDYLKPEGRLILVEYNVDTGNAWVPYPLTYDTWRMMADGCGFKDTQLLGKRPSRFLREIYSALSIKAD